MLPRLCRMPQQLCTFPSRTLLLMMFPLRVELQLNMLRTRVCVVCRYPHCFPVAETRQYHNIPTTDSDLILADEEQYVLHHWGEKALFQSKFSSWIVFRPCFVFNLSQPTSSPLKCQLCSTLALHIAAFLPQSAQRHADRLLTVMARGSLLPKLQQGLLCVFIQNCSMHEGMVEGVLGWDGRGGNRLKDLTQICLLHKTVHDGNVARGTK